MSNCEKKSMVPTCYQMKLGNNTNGRTCPCPQAKKNESSKYSHDKVLERKQKESEEELENAKRTFRSTENVVRQSRNGIRGCPNQVKKATKPDLAPSTPPCKPGLITGREAIMRLTKVPATKECEYPEEKSNRKGKSNVRDVPPVVQNVAITSKPVAHTKEIKRLPKKPDLTSEELSQLIKEEAIDVESAWIITSDIKETYKKPCPKQQKARDAVKALVETKKEESLPCLATPIAKEPAPFLDPDPEDMSPEIAANMMYTQERGIKMISCPEDTVKHLFLDQFGTADEKDTEKNKGSGETEAEGSEAVATAGEVREEEVDDSVFTRNMSQQRESGTDERTGIKQYDARDKTYDKKREFFLQEKAAKCVNRVQLRGNFAPWFPGYFVAFPDHVGDNTIQLAKSPSGVFQKAWMAAKPSNVHSADVYLVE